MMKLNKIKMQGAVGILLVALLVLHLVPLNAQQNPMEAEARRLLEYFLNRETENVLAMLDDGIRSQIPDGQLEEIAEGLEKQLGKFSYAGQVIYDSSEEYDIVTLACRFEMMEIGFRVVFNKEMKVAGFNFVPVPATSFAPPPGYADPELFKETELKVDCGDISLPAILTMPVDGGPHPVVILVHGSGPNDADETIGPNKPFRDIAWGLSSRGIAVLRYEKRTLRHGNTLDRENFTIWEETIDDALAAISTATGIAGIDKERIYLLGHSLGGMVAPAIAENAPELAGIVIMAGNSRPLQELIPEQYEYLMGLQGDLTDEQNKTIDEIRMQVREVNENRLDGLTYRETLLNLPPAYWMDLNRYNQRTTAAGLPQKILVLQGERDYQVTMADFKGWQEALKGHPGARLISYTELNHLMMSGEGAPNPAEYFEKNNVYPGVINDIVMWITGR